MNTGSLASVAAADMQFDYTKGPFEAEGQVQDQDTAQVYYDDLREIKHPYPRPFDGTTTYTDHYPPKAIPLGGPDELQPDLPSLPFKGVPIYTSDYPPRNPLLFRPLGDPVVPEPLPMITDVPTYAAHYPEWPFVAPSPANMPDLPHIDWPRLPTDTTTYRTHYVPKEPHVPHGNKRAPPALPDLPVGDYPKESTYTTHYPPKTPYPGGPQEQEPEPYWPFKGTPMYTTDYPPWPLEHPILLQPDGPIGIRLPMPRESLGVEYVWPEHNPPKKDLFWKLIDKHWPVPCIGKHVFTTTHDNQEVACILVQYGPEPHQSGTASKNQLLGQFDLVGIPPAPKDVPRIEVTFHLSADYVLTAFARDLDTGRQKAWRERGGAIVIR